MSQQTMFGDFEKQRLTKEAPSRKKDPVTSKQAAATVNVANCEMLFMVRLNSIGIATSYEVAEACDYPNKETIRKRSGGLKKKHWIRVVDRNGLTPAGKACERLELTETGRKVLGY